MKKTVAFVMLVVSVLLAAHARAEPFSTASSTSQIGTGGGGGRARRLVLGPPHGGGALQGSTDTFSLGLGGTIVGGVRRQRLVDGPGPDFTSSRTRSSCAGSRRCRRTPSRARCR